MKKRIYTIGREPQCDIWLQDSTDVASRNHAILEVGNGGKYFLTDQSRNGTYVNGIKMTLPSANPVSVSTTTVWFFSMPLQNGASYKYLL